MNVLVFNGKIGKLLPGSKLKVSFHQNLVSCTKLHDLLVSSFSGLCGQTDTQLHECKQNDTALLSITAIQMKIIHIYIIQVHEQTPGN